LSTDPDITSLPSSKDREARANTRLKVQVGEIKEYKNQLSDLEKVFNAINVKLKNLNRLNMDIKVQLRLMESQIKLGGSGYDDPVTKNLMDELKNTALGKDIWEDIETKSEETSTVDPTKLIEAKDLEEDPLTLLNETVDQLISQKNINSVLIQVNNPAISQKAPEINNNSAFETNVVDLDASLTGNGSKIPGVFSKPVEPVKSVDEMEQPKDDLSEYISNLEKSFPEDDSLASVEPSGETTIEPEVITTEIDLDKILIPVTFIGGEQQSKESKLKESKPKETLQEKQKNPNEIDFSALLSQFS
jgi:hypothetical protein